MESSFIAPCLELLSHYIDTKAGVGERMEAERFESLVRDKVERETLFPMLNHCQRKYCFPVDKYTHILIYDHLYTLADRCCFYFLIEYGRSINFVMKGKIMSFPSLKDFQSCPQGTLFTMYNLLSG